MKKIALVFIVLFSVSFGMLYAQDCSDRIQSAGKIYEKYKKTYDKKMLDEARNQLVNIKNTPGAPEMCKKEADRLLKLWKPVYKSKPKANVEVSSITVHVDTVIETKVNIDTIINVIVQHDSLKVKRFYDSEANALQCVQRKDYECAIDNYQTAIAYGRELQVGEEILNTFKSKVLRNQKLQFNKTLDYAKKAEKNGTLADAIQMYETVRRYAVENQLLDEEGIAAIDAKIEYLEAVQQMFEYVEQSNEYFNVQEWELAKQELEMAIELSDTLGWKKGTIYWVHKLDTINNIIHAGENVFDYVSLNEEAYESMQHELENAVHNAILRFYEVPTDTMLIALIVSPQGKTEAAIEFSKSDSMVQKSVLEEISKLRLPAVQYYGQNVRAKASYECVLNVSSTEVVAKVKRWKMKIKPFLINQEYLKNFLRLTDDTITQIKFSGVSKRYLYGRFKFQKTDSKVNDITRNGFSLEKYHGTGGPANVFLSMILPGLGHHRVTYKEKSGAGTIVLFLGSLGAAIGLNYYAIQPEIHNMKDFGREVSNFFDFKSPSYFDNLVKIDGEGNEIPISDEQKKSRKICYYTSYAFAGVSALIYVTDVIWTLVKGSQNLHRQRMYKKFNIGVYYEPAVNAAGLQYNYKFK